MNNTTEYDFKRISVTATSCGLLDDISESAKANCTLKLVIFKVLVPEAIWGQITITTRVFHTKKLALSALFAVVEGDVAFLIAGCW